MTMPMKVALYCALAFAAYALIASTYRDAPTADQLYGCSLAQQDPTTNECR